MNQKSWKIRTKNLEKLLAPPKCTLPSASATPHVHHPKWISPSLSPQKNKIKCKTKTKLKNSSFAPYMKNKQIKIKATLDHRIQMCSAILAAVTGANVLINGCDTIQTSFPNFFLLLKKIGLKYEIQKK